LFSLNPNKLVIPATLNFSTRSIQHSAFIDSGADGVFIDEVLVSKFKIPVFDLPTPITLILADGKQAQNKPYPSIDI
jgi:hypothetical protein